ncbi:hypothetical protein KDA11_02910 [Candidatus Saccharibacteria bacterium]|nr:hypothetical protein [Candidatus Saccharibacteria bacterium]
MAPRFSKITTTTNGFIADWQRKNHHVYPNKRTDSHVDMLDCYRELANAVRRTALGELSGLKRLELVRESYSTTEQTLIMEHLAKNIELLPLNQSAPLGTEFTLSERHNNTSTLIDVFTHDIPGISKYVNHINLFFLRPGSTVSFKLRVVEGSPIDNANFRVVSSLGFKSDLGNKVEDGFVDEPTHYKFHFRTNGVMDVADILKMTCDSLVERAEKIRPQLSKLRFDQNLGEGVVIIGGETHTFTNLLTHFGLTQNTAISAEDIDVVVRSFSLRIRQTSRDSALAVLNKCLDLMIADFKVLKKSLP